MNKMEQMEKRIAELETKLNNVTVSQDGTSPWHEVREYVIKQEEELFSDHRDVNRFHTGLTTVLRFTLGLKSIRFMTPDMVPQAKDIADRIIGMVKEHRDELVESIERGNIAT